MKDKIKLFGLIVLAAVIGLSMTACPADAGGSSGNGGNDSNPPITIGSTDGKLIINDSLTGYNDKWIIAQGQDGEGTPIYAAGNITGTTSANITITGAPISSDSATLKVWKGTDSGLGNYNGNDTIAFSVAILNKATLNASEYAQLVAYYSGGYLPDFVGGGSSAPVSVTFVNGIGTITAGP